MHIKLAVDDDGKEVRMSFPHTNEMDLHDYACMFVQAVGRETDNLPVLRLFLNLYMLLAQTCPHLLYVLHNIMVSLVPWDPE